MPAVLDQAHSLKLELPRKLPSLHDPPPAPSKHLTRCLRNRPVQVLFEKNLEALLGVRFLTSEFTTTHGGRIDTLGLDENGSPVILEYKRATNENVINQGLFYLDWLMDHKKDFQWLVLEKLGKEAADDVDWSAPRPRVSAAPECFLPGPAEPHGGDDQTDH
jgi:hypothetical protein